jgi:hypothetical protein
MREADQTKWRSYYGAVLAAWRAHRIPGGRRVPGRLLGSPWISVRERRGDFRWVGDR